MADLVNPTVVSPGMMGGGYGGMMGGGSDGIGALLIGALLFGGGLGGFGGNRNNLGTDGGLLTTTQLQNALNAQTANSNQNATLQQLATIQQLIPENEGRVQLAVSAATNQLTLQNGQLSGLALQQSNLIQQAVATGTQAIKDVAAQNRDVSFAGFSAGQLQAAQNAQAITATIEGARRDLADDGRMSDAATAAGFAAGQLALANVHSSTLQSFAAVQLQAANNAAAIVQAIGNDGDATRSLIIAQNDATLNRIITTQANEIIELKNDRNIVGRSRETEVNVSQTVNQAQAQTQAQQQQQQQFQILSQIAASLNGLTQIAHATNQNVIAGNTGAVTTGAQSANPVNVA